MDGPIFLPSWQREKKRVGSVFSFFFPPFSFYSRIWKLGIETELQLPAYARTTATQLHLIVNPLIEARDRTHILADTTLGPYPAEPQYEL